MNSFPSNIYAEVGSSEDISAPIIRTESEGGYVRSRRRYTRVKRKFTLKYPNLTLAEKTTLVNFYAANAGSAFYYTDQCTNTVYTVLFPIDSIQVLKNATTYSIDIVLEEI